MSFLFVFVLALAMICLLGFFNEKVTKLTYEIALMLFSVVIGAAALLAATVFSGTSAAEILGKIQVFNIEKFLMDGVLCFMLFAGSCHLKLSDFKRQARQVTVLAFVCTLLGACFYGLLFYGAAYLMGLNLSLPMCLMFGSIVAPTDPIAATSILNKFGLPKNISFLIEGESLFNDGVGVALFVCFSGLATATSSSGFFSVMLPQIFGAVAVGAVATLLLFPLYRFTKSNTLGIFVSLLSVALSYYLCELFGFSGAIASVIHLLFSMLFHFQGFVSGGVRFTAGLIFNGWGVTEETLVNDTPYRVFLAVFAAYAVLYVATLTLSKYLGAQHRIIDRAELRKGEDARGEDGSEQDNS